MILGFGTDILEVERMAEKLRKDEGFASGLFTPQEIAYCSSMNRPAEHYAARFAAKEALFKALGTGWGSGLSWLDIEISHDRAGRPLLALSGETARLAGEKGVRRIHVSLSHTHAVATAGVILES